MAELLWLLGEVLFWVVMGFICSVVAEGDGR